MSCEPGDRAPAPEPLRVVQRFVNTTDLEDGTDELHSPAALAAWLRAAGLLASGAAPRAGRRRVLAAPFSARLEPAAGGVDGALGRIVAVIHAAIADGTWERLKACERDVCRWAFYDRSKNRSGHWCATNVCGQ